MAMPESSGSDALRLSRRTWLKIAAAAELGAWAAPLPPAVGQAERLANANASDWPDRVLPYLETLARPTGGYAWDDLARSHLTPTFAVIGTYRLLDRPIPRRTEVVEFVRTHHPAQLKKLEQEHRVFEYEQIQSLRWLEADVREFRPVVASWVRPTRYLPQYERSANPVFRYELAAFTCRALLGLPHADLAPAYVGYLDARRRQNGSFNATPAADGSDGHVTNTWWGLEALATLGRGRENAADTIAWIRSCQLPEGGFTYQPHAPFAGVANAFYTWAAVRALAQLGSEPADRPACIRFLLSLANTDGGCGDRPGWMSNPVATFRVLEALATLGARAPAATRTEAKLRPRPARPRENEQALPPGLNVYSIQIEAHGQGSPRDAVALARGLKIDLWGAKNARPGWIARAQEIADRDKVPVRFFTANEEYGTWVQVPGLGTYSHTSDLIAPAGREIGASLANQGVVSWPEFRARRLAPLEAAGGHLVWQFGENEELARIYLDDSIARGGYAAISTFHFGNPDFTNTEPFLDGYRGQIPFVALQDAHGGEPWWFADMTAGFRTLFLAREPTWEAWLDALKNNRVASVRHDAVSHFATWMHGGDASVLDLLRTREAEWRWWDNPRIARPLVSLVALDPADEFEAARPERGITLRVRCAWENTAQGLLRTPIAELVHLSVDDKEVTPELVQKTQAGRDVLADHYHLHHMPAVAPGAHTARAVVRALATKAEHSAVVRFGTA